METGRAISDERGERSGPALGAEGVSQADGPRTECLSDDRRQLPGPDGDHLGSLGPGDPARFRGQGAQNYVLRRLKRFNVLVCHRGWGKTTLGVNRLVQAACATESGRFAYLAPLYKQVKKTAWDALKLHSRAPGVKANETELRVDVPNGARIQLFGADDYDALRGMHLDGIVLDEYAQMHPDAWDAVIRPALAIKRGFAIFIGTPQGRNHFYALYEQAKGDPEWFTALYRWQESGVFEAEDGEAEIRRARATMSSEMFAQEYECSFEAAIRGAYYARQLEQAQALGRIRDVPYEPDGPVETWWDLGWDDATAIIFTQRVGREVHLIDYLEANHEPLSYYAKELRNREYVYGDHHLPHDADKTELGSGQSLREQLRRLGLQHLSIVRQVEVEEGIQAARALFPRCWFDQAKMRRLIDCLANYRQEWIEARQTFGTKPLHDQYSHGADAFRYLAVGLREYTAPVGQRYATTQWDRFTGQPSAPRRAVTSLSTVEVP